MNTKEYDWKKFTDKDMFQIMLSGDIPDFGYISISLRRPFLEFLVKYKFMQDNGSVMDRLWTHKDSETLVRRYSEFRKHYTVFESFQYHQMDGYRPIPNKVHAKQNIFTVKDLKMITMKI